MAIIWLPQPTHINPSATSPDQSPVRLKCATTMRKIKESSKVPKRVRLFRLLHEIIAPSYSGAFNCCFLETIPASTVAEFAYRR